ncbi:MAG TPA: helix-turn-helix domain-containing GNAT family N-acetyltransferase [Rhodocyclaceae bacterium]|nr:helix-turn-helix domain-containing GNAT family N-acetyltransferase [Rhodocyclaceae bacterium]
MSANVNTIESIRTASRRLVRELGFMSPVIAATDLAPSAVHTLLEIDVRGPMTALQLTKLLGLDKSSISRLVKKLVEAGELQQETSTEDGRHKWLTLTRQGRKTATALHAFGRTQVEGALQHLPPAQRPAVIAGLEAYGGALEKNRTGTATIATTQAILKTGYQPGIIGRIAQMHGTYYARKAGFGQFFESKVASETAEFAGRLDRPKNQLWSAWLGDAWVGSIAIDGEDLEPGNAHLRWFIVDDAARGQGLGKRLLDAAIAFCRRQDFQRITLWTIHGLTAARHLYDAAGFKLEEEVNASQWGKKAREQRLVLRLS